MVPAVRFSSSGAMLGNGRAPRAAASRGNPLRPLTFGLDPGNATPRHIEVVPAVSVVPAAPLSRGADTTEIRAAKQGCQRATSETAAAAPVSTPTRLCPRRPWSSPAGSRRAAWGPDPAAVRWQWYLGRRSCAVGSCGTDAAAWARPVAVPDRGRSWAEHSDCARRPFRGIVVGGMFRRIETVYGLVPVPGTPWMSSPP